MDNKLLRDTIGLLEKFESENQDYTPDIEGFQHWVVANFSPSDSEGEPYWEGKENGRSPESAINTLFVHLNRYAKNYSKSAIHGSSFSTQEEFSYLINLKAYGAMNKMELIKRNIQDKPTGMQIINRLLAQGWIEQADSVLDKRSKIITINEVGKKILDQQMGKIRQATRLVAGNLTYNEKMQLIHLLNKLEHFHKPIFNKNIDSSELLNAVTSEFLPTHN